MPISRRITRVLLAFSTALVLAWSGPAWAQSAEMHAAFKQYQVLQKQGKYAEDIPFAQKVNELAKKELGGAKPIFASGLITL